MTFKSLTALPLVLIFSLNQVHAQEKLPVTLSALLSYPISFGDNTLEITNTLIGWDLNAQFPLSGHWTTGPSYRAGIYGTNISYTDESGNVSDEKFTTSLLHHLEVLTEYHKPLADKLTLRFGIAAGYSFMNESHLFTYVSGKAPKGFDISPGITFQYSLTDHFALSSSAKYTYTNLTATMDVGATSSAYNENIHEAAIAVGATFLF